MSIGTDLDAKFAMIEAVVWGHELRLRALEGHAPPGPIPPPPEAVTFTFNDYSKQAASADRIYLSGHTATSICCQTYPGDDNIYGSGTAERADLCLTVEQTGALEGGDQWWAQSILLPSDYQIPPACPDYCPSWHLLCDFHHTGSTGQANLQLKAMTPSSDSGNPVGTALPPCMRFELNAQGANQSWDIGPPIIGRWFELVYHVRWSSGPSGFWDIWLNGEKKIGYQGPTLYAGQGTYFKPANYHVPYNVPVAVIHDNVRRGVKQSQVTRTHLQDSHHHHPHH